MNHFSFSDSAIKSDLQTANPPKMEANSFGVTGVGDYIPSADNIVKGIDAGSGYMPPQAKLAAGLVKG